MGNGNTGRAPKDPLRLSDKITLFLTDFFSQPNIQKRFQFLLSLSEDDLRQHVDFIENDLRKSIISYSTNWTSSTGQGISTDNVHNFFTKDTIYGTLISYSKVARESFQVQSSPLSRDQGTVGRLGGRTWRFLPRKTT